MTETEKKYDYSQFTDEDAAMYREILDAEPYREELQKLFAIFKREERVQERRSERHESLYPLNLDSLQIHTPDESLTDHLIAKEKEAMVESVINKLPDAIAKLIPVQRKRIIEHYYLGISQAQIARNDGVCKRTVQRCIRRAVKKLKTFF